MNFKFVKLKCIIEKPGGCMKKISVLLILCLIGFASCKNKEEQKNSAEDTAKFLAEKKARMAKGVGEAMKGEGKDAADSVGEGVGEVLKGGGSGLDKSLLKINVEIDKQLSDAGVSLGRTARLEKKNEKGQDGVTLYFIYNKAFNGTVLLKAFDAKGTEVGRSSSPVKGTADNTQYVNFYFDERVPLNIVTKYTLNKK
jgi:hypothetical protein